MSSQGEFIEVMVKKQRPEIGQEYTGEMVKYNKKFTHFYKIAAVACFLFVLISSSMAYAYFKPVSTIVLTINPSIELKVNRFNKVLKVVGLNNDGKKIINEVNIKNKSIDDALNNILKQAKEDKFINDSYIKADKTVSLDIQGRNVNITSFKENIIKDKINMDVKVNGEIKEHLNNNNSNKNKEKGKGNIRNIDNKESKKENNSNLKESIKNKNNNNKIKEEKNNPANKNNDSNLNNKNTLENKNSNKKNNNQLKGNGHFNKENEKNKK